MNTNIRVNNTTHELSADSRLTLGTRVRSLPISVEKVLGHEAFSPRVSSPRAGFAGKARSASHEAV